jgi:hypothetical protein
MRLPRIAFAPVILATAAFLMGPTGCGKASAAKDKPAAAAAAHGTAPAGVQEADMALETPSPVPSLDSLALRAQAALVEANLDLVLSPVLPAAWPPEDPAVEYFAYASMPLPSGVIAYRISGPKAKVAVGLSDGSAIISPLEDGMGSGRQDGMGPGAQDLAKAQAALLEVVAGRRTPQAAKADLRAYLKWSHREAVMGADARKRKPGFFAWLEAKDPATASPR